MGGAPFSFRGFAAWPSSLTFNFRQQNYAGDFIHGHLAFHRCLPQNKDLTRPKTPRWMGEQE